MKTIIQNIGGTLAVFAGCIALVNLLAWHSPVLNNGSFINTTGGPGVYAGSNGISSGNISPSLWKNNSIIIFGTYKKPVTGYAASVTAFLNVAN